MSNSDDQKFDDFQIPEEGSSQDQPDFEFDDFLNTDDDSTYISLDEPSELNLSAEGGESSLDLPDESQLGENTSPYADELELFGELDMESLAAAELPTEEQVSGDVSEQFAETLEIADDMVSEDFIADLEPAAADDEDSFHFFDDMEAETPEPVIVAETVEITEDVESIGDFFDNVDAVEEPMELADFSGETLFAEESDMMTAEVTEEMPYITEAADDAEAIGDFLDDVEAVEEPTNLADFGGDDIVANGFDGLPLEDTAAVDDRKSKKAKKEKPPKVKKEKAPKVKKEKKRKEPGEKQPLNVSALSFIVCLGLMIAVFAGVNLYAVMKYGIGAMIFLAIFDLLALGALAIPFLLRRSKNSVTSADVTLGIAAVSLIFGCMFLLANLAFNLGS